MSTPKANILVVEDEKAIREVLSLSLSLDGYEVYEAHNGEEAINNVNNNNIHLVIMDVMMPKVNGIEALKRIKSKRPQLPIIMLSALDQSIDRVKGLKAGADDYVNKPFNYEELLLRVEKQLDNVKVKESAALEFKIGQNTINVTLNTVSNSKGKFQLSSKEINLLKYLYTHRNRVISREELFADVWGYNTFPNSRTVDNYVSALRKYLYKEDGSDYIQSERGVGYKFIL